MFLIEESIKLLWKIVEDGKANRISLDSQKNEFLEAASKAVRKTLSYIRDGNKRDEKTEQELSELWADVALAARPFDSDLAERCHLKGNYWADPERWSKEEIADARIEIGRIDDEIRNHFKGGTRGNKSTGLKTNIDPSKVSLKTIIVTITSLIIFLAALTTFTLNLDKIKGKFKDKVPEQKPKQISIPQAKSPHPTNNGIPEPNITSKTIPPLETKKLPLSFFFSHLESLFGDSSRVLFVKENIDSMPDKISLNELNSILNLFLADSYKVALVKLLAPKIDANYSRKDFENFVSLFLADTYKNKAVALIIKRKQ